MWIVLGSSLARVTEFFTHFMTLRARRRSRNCLSLLKCAGRRGCNARRSAVGIPYTLIFRRTELTTYIKVIREVARNLHDEFEPERLVPVRKDLAKMLKPKLRS